MTLAELALALPFAIPLVFGLCGLLLRRPHRRSRNSLIPTPFDLGAIGTGAPLVLILVLLYLNESYHNAYELVRFGDLTVEVAVQVDQPALLVGLAVTVVALAVHFYSVAYLPADDRYAPYAAQVTLFTGAMLLVVFSGDLVLLLVGWEIMGICSYLLIAHDRRLPGAPGAAMKAFLVTRVGDVGFWLGIILLGVAAGSFQISEVVAAVGRGEVSAAMVTAAGLLLLLGVAGKSAQFPLHTWLPDAMAGPTPISALIHAATMVAAGVYVVFRLFPIFAAGTGVLAVLGVVAAVTMLLGALAATAADDIKRVLAWSTVSQLAYMTGALAVGATSAALFHLLSHAAFKALLFFAAGAVIHAVGSNLMSAMGGLRRGMPVTFATTTVGLAALVGLPPLAGFWSKDAILYAAAGEAGWVAALVFGAGLLTVVITGWYATRLWLRTFFGPRSRAAEAHDPPALMTWPLCVLAVPTALLGVAALFDGVAARLVAPPSTVEGYLGGVTPELPPEPELVHFGVFMLLPLAAAGLGVALAWWRWRRDPATDPATVLGPLRPVFAAGFYLDAVQRAVVVRPVQALAGLVSRGDATVVDGAVTGAGRGTVGLGTLLARAHQGTVTRALTAVLAGALLIGIAALLYWAIMSSLTGPPGESAHQLMIDPVDRGVVAG
ncbi:NADH-quinone oxidoreductase subunit L [Natronosporangium hydrolyticum]|uniref:NADH-quinone oxidoreductase subunit L n=1 Tax=Natronosporangium hydrolyticum TaxID=2811111 RepID=A0A895YGX3_9ACTN|nr:NADH-quinone oxidoreductase subunit L [Natronosporangium hydrolyticum]